MMLFEPLEPIASAITASQVFFVFLTVIMTNVVLLGLLRREKHGVGNIGFESILDVLIYLGALTLLFHGQ